MRPDPITATVARNLCTGCGACAGAFPQAIRMVDDPVHGRRPVVAPTAEGRAAAVQASGLCAGAVADWRTLERRDALEVFYICVVLGFRGLYRDTKTSEPLLSSAPSRSGWGA